jgi:hypothetical protein
MTRLRTIAAAAAAMLSVATPTIAAAQACVSAPEVQAMTIYAVPASVQALELRCADQLTASGFLAREGRGFAQRYAALQTRNWPQAKSGLLKVLGSNAVAGQVRDNLSLIAALPDQHVRPLVDALLVQELSGRIPLADCGTAEQLLETLSTIEPQVAGTLVSQMLTLFGNQPALICPATRP